MRKPRFARPRRQAKRRGFTLLELMVSMSVLAIIMVMVFQMLSQMQSAWSASRARLSTFKEARVAFEAITRRLSQATLNTYWDYKFEGSGNSKRPVDYEKQSDLHFVCGQADDLIGDRANHPGHAIFFQAPIGFSVDQDNAEFSNLLNGWGYFVEKNDGSQYAPNFLPTELVARERYRLMEFRPPTEDLAIYETNLKNEAAFQSQTQIHKWFHDKIHERVKSKGAGASAGMENSRPIAENILLLLIEPREADATKTSTNTLAPDYLYDTREFQYAGAGTRQLKTRHVLPPILEVTMVAIDEESAIRYAQLHDETMAGLIPEGLFRTAASYRQDIEALENALAAARVDYRIFRETVSIKASNWGWYDGPGAPKP